MGLIFTYKMYTKKYGREDTPYMYIVIHVCAYVCTHVLARINPYYTTLYPSQRYQLHMQGFEILRYTSIYIYNRSDLITRVTN